MKLAVFLRVNRAMPHLLVPTARLMPAVTLILSLAAACGGRSFDDAATGAGTASGGSQPRAGDGAGARGGRGSTGGTSAGGSSATGGTLGIAWPRECSDPPETGSCDAYFQRWYLDIATGICTPFVYGGCGGNDNNYESLAACQNACANANPSYDYCQVAGDCMIAGPGCCGACDGPNVSAHALIAYAKRYRENVGQACGGITCGACEEVPPSGGQLKYFVPDCINNQCVVTDIRTSLISACSDDQDCFLRYGTQCCPGCDGRERVAISNYEALEELICGSDVIGCPAIGCNPAPGGATAYCDAGHCAVRLETLE